MKLVKTFLLLFVSVLSISSLFACMSNHSDVMTSLDIDMKIFENESSITICRENNTLITTEDEVRILQLTDVQFENYFEEKKIADEIVDLVKKTNPDLIVFTGDTLNNDANKIHLEIFIKFMDTFETPWTVVMGNHDYNADAAMQTQCRMYESSEYCIFKTGNLSESNGNYYYTLVKEDVPFYSLIFMDSGKNGFTENHVLWYENTINQLTNENTNEYPKSLLFYHIPIYEATDIYSKYAKLTENSSGELREDMCSQKYNVGFLDKIAELGSTTDMFFGHDHLNNAFVKYNGIGFYYGLKTGSNSYYDSDMQGGNLIIVNTSKQVTVERIYN